MANQYIVYIAIDKKNTIGKVAMFQKKGSLWYMMLGDVTQKSSSGYHLLNNVGVPSYLSARTSLHVALMLHNM